MENCDAKALAEEITLSKDSTIDQQNLMTSKLMMSSTATSTAAEWIEIASTKSGKKTLENCDAKASAEEIRLSKDSTIDQQSLMTSKLMMSSTATSTAAEPNLTNNKAGSSKIVSRANSSSTNDPLITQQSLTENKKTGREKLEKVLMNHKPTIDLKLTYQHLGGIISNLPDGKKETFALLLSHMEAITSIGWNATTTEVEEACLERGEL